MGIDLGKMINGAVKGVSGFIDKTGKDIAKAIDQNGDGKLDLSDIQIVSDRIQANQAEARRKADLERLKPLFPDDFERAEFVMPKMILVAKMRHMLKIQSAKALLDSKLFWMICPQSRSIGIRLTISA